MFTPLHKLFLPPGIPFLFPFLHSRLSSNGPSWVKLSPLPIGDELVTLFSECPEALYLLHAGHKVGLTAATCLLPSPGGGFWRQGPPVPILVSSTSWDFADVHWMREALRQQDEGAGNRQVSRNECSTEELGNCEVRSHGLFSG